jgi:DeoR family transcriptional regulator, aga operon transcriptional repressor
VNRVMFANARRTIVVCDSSKFGCRGLSLIAATSAVHDTITDDKIPPKYPRGFRQTELKVVLV